MSKKIDLTMIAVDSLMSAFALAEDRGVVVDEVRETYEAARAKGKEPTEAERRKIRNRAVRRARNLARKIARKNK